METESSRRDLPGANFEGLNKLLLEALNKKRLLILSHVANNSFRSLTAILFELSKVQGIPISTLKLNAKKLSELQLIETVNGIAKITELGSFVLENLNADRASGIENGIKFLDKIS